MQVLAEFNQSTVAEQVREVKRGYTLHVTEDMIADVHDTMRGALKRRDKKHQKAAKSTEAQ